MPMIRIRPLLLAVVLAMLNLASPAAAAVTCSATAVPVVFDPIYDLVDPTATGAGALDVSCGSGSGSDVVHVCLQLGPGSAGGTANTNVRYLISALPSPSYSLQVGTSGLPVDQKANIGSFVLSEQGEGAAAFTINGLIDWAGYTGDPGGFTSDFASNQVSFSFGSTEDCSDGGSDVGGFSVTGSIFPSCTVSAGDLDFGAISATISEPIDAQTSLFVTCTFGVPFSVTLGTGHWGASTPTARRMKNGEDVLTYGLFQDPSRSLAWGWSASDDVQDLGTGSQQSFDVFGRINAAQTAVVGRYEDMVVITVSY